MVSECMQYEKISVFIIQSISNHLSLVTTKQTIKHQVAEEHWPLTFNVLEPLQLPRLIVQPLRVLNI